MVQSIIIHKYKVTQMSDTFNIKKQKDVAGLTALLFFAVIVFSVNLSLTTDPILLILFLAISVIASVLLSALSTPALSVIAGIFGFAISLLVLKEPAFAAVSAIHVPFACWLSQAFRNKLSRSSAVGGAAFTVTICALAVLLYHTYSTTGTVSADSVIFTFREFFDSLSDLLYTSFYVEILGNEVPVITKTNVRPYLNFFIGIFPGIIAAASSFIGFIVISVCKKILERFTAFTARRSIWISLVSPITAIFFLLSYLLSLIFTETNFFTLSLINLELILFAFIFTAGLLSAFEPITSNGITRPRILRPLLLIIALFNSTNSFATLCIFFGLYDCIKETVAAGIKKKKQE